MCKITLQQVVIACSVVWQLDMDIAQGTDIKVGGSGDGLLEEGMWYHLEREI